MIVYVVINMQFLLPIREGWRIDGSRGGVFIDTSTPATTEVGLVTTSKRTGSIINVRDVRCQTGDYPETSHHHGIRKTVVISPTDSDGNAIGFVKGRAASFPQPLWRHQQAPVGTEAGRNTRHLTLRHSQQPKYLSPPWTPQKGSLAPLKLMHLEVDYLEEYFVKTRIKV